MRPPSHVYLTHTYIRIHYRHPLSPFLSPFPSYAIRYAVSCFFLRINFPPQMICTGICCFSLLMQFFRGRCTRFVLSSLGNSIIIIFSALRMDSTSAVILFSRAPQHLALEWGWCALSYHIGIDVHVLDTVALPDPISLILSSPQCLPWSMIQCSFSLRFLIFSLLFPVYFALIQ
jgi:hypothetical protein